MKAGKNETFIKSFEPIIDKNCRVLILGTMPGEESLRQQQYYAHPRNLFWPLIYKIFDKSPDTNYSEKRKFLLDKGIGLWDVYKSCQREGSLDSNIRMEELNDIPALLKSYPAIKYIFCNGSTAEKQFVKNFLPKLTRSVYYMRLASTSPANASVTYQEKLNQWLSIKRTLNNLVRHKSSLKTDLGTFTIISDTEKITQVCFPGSQKPKLNQYAVFTEDKICTEAKKQIKEYLTGNRKTFSVPFAIGGTDFEKRVYRALLEIPYGSTISYGDLAEMAGNKKAARAVGQVLRKNPVPLLFPCHRVVGSKGKSIGFMGIRSNPMQERLLGLEQHNSR